MDEYSICATADDGRPVESREFYVLKNGFANHVRKSKRAAQWVATRMSKGLYVPDEDQMSPDQIREMEEDQPE